MRAIAIVSRHRLAALLSVLLAPACVAHPPASAPAKEYAAMSTSANASLAQVDAEQLIGRILKLIDSVHAVADLAPDNIERQTGLPVTVHSADRREYGAAGRVAPDWAFSLSSVAYKQGQAPTRLDFDFIDTRAVRDGAADTAPICAMDFDAYGRALAGIGFQPVPLAESKRAPAFGYQGVEPWRFVRGEVQVTVQTYGDRDPGAGKACVSGLHISVLG